MTNTLEVVDRPEDRKARGAFFTPEPLARFIANWAVTTAHDRVLEPSCGDASFLVEAVRKLKQLDPRHDHRPAVTGIEIHGPSAENARRAVSEAGGDGAIEVGDFFEYEPTERFDAVIGNPPYVRYQEFSGEARARSRAASLRAGVRLTGLASSWAAFTVHSALFLRPGGRLGMVIPAELLSVNYAAPVRQFLLERFSRVDLVLFEERVFPEVQEEVVLLMASGYAQGSSTHANIYQAKNAEMLTSSIESTRWEPESLGGKWTGSLLSSEALSVYLSAVDSGAFCDLEAWGDTTLGMVTGNNRYFTMGPRRAEELGISGDHLIRLSPPGSTHLRGLAFTTEQWEEMGNNGANTHLFRPAHDVAGGGSEEYIAAGETAGVHQAYKCRVRKPWWRVPLVPPADLFLTYMNADTVRISENQARVHHLNSVHGVYLRPELVTLGRRFLPIATLNSVSLVGAEMVGRSYGGGMLKIEPREADRLPVPSPEVVRSTAASLNRIRRKVSTRLVRGGTLAAVEVVNEAILIGELGLSPADARELSSAYSSLAARRKTRGKNVGA